MGLSHSPTIVTNGLVMHLDPNNIKSYSYPASGTAWNDLSGNQNNATLVNTPTYKNTSGGYFTFNGVDEYASVPHSSSIQSPYITLCCWARLANWNVSTDARMVSKTESGGYNLGINDTNISSANQGKISFAVRISGAYVYSNYDLSNLSSGWHYIVGTTDGKFVDLYIDGVLVNRISRVTLDPIQYANENNLQIGTEAGPGSTPQTPGSFFWPGSIGPVSVYNRALSDTEVLQNFQAYQRRYIDPDVLQSRLILNLDATNAASYPGTGTSWKDISGEQNNVTLKLATYDATSGSFNFNVAGSYAQGYSINPIFFITVDIWVKWNTIDAFGIPMVSNYDPEFGHNGIITGYSLYLSPLNKKISWTVVGDLGTGNLSASNLLNTGSWYNIVATYDGKKMSLYINGAFDSQITAVLGTIKPTTNSPLSIGTYVDGSSPTDGYVHGNISAVKIYSRALSPPEIFQNYQAIRRRYELVEYDGPQIINNGLVLNLDAGDPLSYPKTGTSWLDLSGNSNNGTLTNGPVYNKARGGVISFDGVDDVVVTNDTNLRFNTPTFTVCAMFYWNGANTASALVSKRNGATPNQQYTISVAGDIAASTVGNNLQLVAKDDSNSTTVGLQYALPAAGWYYVVGVISTLSQTLYVNGVSRASSTVDLTGKTFNIPSKDLCIGAAVNDGGNGYSYFYGGNISRVMIYNRALTADEVTQNFKAVRGRYGL